MAKLKLMHSPRVGKSGLAPILIMVGHKSKQAYINLDIDIEPSNFVNGQVVNRTDAKMLNNIIKSFMTQVEANLLRLTTTTDITNFDVKELRDRISPTYDPVIEEEKKKQKNSFINIFVEFKNTHANKGTVALYQRTEDAIRAYDKDVEGKSFEEIDTTWLNKFKSARSECENVNTIGIHLMHIRAVFNYAIYELEITTAYPFRKKRNKVTIDRTTAETIPMPLEHLREMWNAKLEPWQERWVDLAKLVFLFIGINMADLSELKEIDQLGYINYQRRKTRDRSHDGAHYHIKVEPEAMEIINKWKGKEHLLSHFDGRKNYKSADKQMVHAVKCIGLPTPPCIGGQGHKAEIPRHSKKRVTEKSKFGYFCLYALRKAWATIAFNECGISMETISLALGHTSSIGKSVTQRYVYFNNKLIDDANRRVIDWVLYNKKIK